MLTVYPAPGVGKTTTCGQHIERSNMANETVNKTELINEIAELTGHSKKDTGVIVNALFDQVVNNLKNGSKVQVAGFGTFEVRHRKARTGVKPGTTEKVEIPASNAPAFKPGKTFKEAVN